MTTEAERTAFRQEMLHTDSDGNALEIPAPFDQTGIAENPWYADSARFVSALQNRPHRWLVNTQTKYVDIRIDTRDGGFVVKDRDGNRISPNEILGIPEGRQAAPLLSE